MPPPPDDPAALAPLLASATGVALGAEVTITDLTRLSGGASRETWSFVAHGDAIGDRNLILQRLRPGGSVAGPSMAVEDRLLASAAAAGVPVAPSLVDAAEIAGLGSARVSERVAGEALGPRIVRVERSEAARRSLARQMGAALAGIHTIAPTTLGEAQVVDPLARVRDGLDLLGEVRPALELGLRRLATTRPDPGPATVVHGDFRVGNLLIDDDRLTAVLDWELAHLGDPAEDLGWLCGRAWRFGGNREVGGVADLEDLLAGYADAGGRHISAEAVRWWTAAGTLLWGLICAVQARRHLDGHIRSVELATIGRRVCEAEYDLLDLVLDPSDVAPSEVAPSEVASSASPPSAGPTAGGSEGSAGVGEGFGLHGRPTAAELVDAVRGHLAEEVAPELEGSARFHTRVAVHALEVVERELRLAPIQRRAHARRLADLGFDDEARLAAAIRAGDLDGQADVASAVRADVVERLRVANPDWLHPPDV